MKNYYKLSCFGLFIAVFLMACNPDKEMPGVYDSCCGSEPVEFSPQGTTARVYVPNVFTPNGDNVNDYFFPFSNGEILIINYMVITKKEEDGSTTVLYQRENIDPNDINNYWWGTDIEGIRYKGGFDYQISFYTTDSLAFAVQGKGCSVICEGESPVDNPREGCFYPAQNNGDGTFNLNLPTGEHENCF